MLSFKKNLLIAIACLGVVLTCTGFDGGSILFIALIGVGIVLYFLPAVIGNDKKDSTAIFVLNLFLGWTLIGWVGALVWALSSPEVKKESRYFYYDCPKCGYKGKLDQQVKLYVCPQCKTETPYSALEDKAKAYDRSQKK